MRVTLALVLATGLLLAACNSDDNSGGATGGIPLGAGTKASTSAADAKPPLKLAAGASVTIGTAAGQTKVADGQPIQCDQNSVTVADASMDAKPPNLTFTGECRSITVGAGPSALQIDRVKTLTLTGSTGSIVTAKAVDTIVIDATTIGASIRADSNLAGTGKPKCEDSGTGDTCP